MKDVSADLPHLYPDLKDWPIYKLHHDREAFVSLLTEESLAKVTGQHRNTIQLLQDVIYSEKARVRKEPWKVDPPNELAFWKRMERKLVEGGLDPDDPADARAREAILRQIVANYAEEVVGDFSIPTFQFARRFLTIFFNRLLTAAGGRNLRRLARAKISVRERLIVGGKVAQLRAMFEEHHVVFVPTHFSNLDSILIGYALDAFAGIPHSTFGAGINLLNTGWVAYFINRFGAYRVDRRKKNPIYLEVLKSFSRLAISRGYNSTFFPGGTRSRKGSLESEVKLGLLGTAVEAQRRLLQSGSDKKVVVVPLVTSYHFVLEAKFLIQGYLRQVGKSQYVGAPSSQFTYKGFFRFLWQLFSSSSEIYINVGQPLDVLGNHLDTDGTSVTPSGKTVALRDYFLRAGEVTEDPQRERQYTALLGDAVVERFHADNVALTSHVVAYCAFRMLRQFYPDLDVFGVLRLDEQEFLFDLGLMQTLIERVQARLTDLEGEGKIQLSAPLRQSPASVLRDGVAKMQLYHAKPPLSLDGGRCVSKDFHLLYFYHNRMDGYALEAASTVEFDGGVRNVQAARLALQEAASLEDVAVEATGFDDLPIERTQEKASSVR